jgi:hypothetical protein
MIAFPLFLARLVAGWVLQPSFNISGKKILDTAAVSRMCHPVNRAGAAPL